MADPASPTQNPSIVTTGTTPSCNCNNSDSPPDEYSLLKQNVVFVCQCLLPLFLLYVTLRVWDFDLTLEGVRSTLEGTRRVVLEVVFGPPSRRGFGTKGLNGVGNGVRLGSTSSHATTSSSGSSESSRTTTAPTITTVTPPPFTPPNYSALHRALHSYTHYTNITLSEIQSMKTSYARSTYKHKQIGYELGYVGKLRRAAEVSEVNERVVQGIVRLAKREFGLEVDANEENEVEAGGYKSNHGEARSWWERWFGQALSMGDLGAGVKPDIGRVREALKHFVRDWSEEGREERVRIFSPILDVLGDADSDSERRKGMKVLVPGSGLGRLAWEIAELGYDTTAIELSYFMTLAFRFLLSPKATQEVNQHTVHPYAYWFSHTRKNENTFRSVTFPDVIPRYRDNLHLVEGDFLKHHTKQGYDYIVTLFFIDTSLDIVSTLEHIYALLHPGGTWINLGPLLWTGGAQARMELSLEEVIRLAEMVGFRFEWEGEEGGDTGKQVNARMTRTIECEYTADRMAMMKWLYQAEFWVTTKPLETSSIQRSDS